MYNASISEPTTISAYSWWQKTAARIRAGIATHATAANLIGLFGALGAIICLIALPDDEYWNIRVPLYLAIAIWTLLRPRAALYLLPIAVPWGSIDPIDLAGLNVNSADILVFLLLSGWLLSFPLSLYSATGKTDSGPLDRGKAGIPRYLLFALLAFLFSMLLSMTVTTNLVSSIKEIIKWFEMLVVLYLGAQYIRTRRHIWTLITIMFLAAVSQAFAGYIQAFFNLGPEAFIRSDGLRVYGTFGQPNPYAGYINITLAIAIALTLLSRSWGIRFAAGLTTVLLAYAEYLSQSRGGQIALAATIFCIIMVGMPRLRIFIGTGAIAGLCIIAAYLGGLMPARFLNPILKFTGLASISFSAPGPEDFSTAERLAHWIAGIRMFLDQPFLGIGIGNYAQSYPQYFITIFADPLGHAHNYYINIAAETGILGLTSLSLFLLTIFIIGAHTLQSIREKSILVKDQRQTRPAGATNITYQTTRLLQMLADDRALTIGLLGAVLSICVHNMVDNLYVHSMTNLFALLLVLLIRLEGVASNIGNNGGRKY